MITRLALGLASATVVLYLLVVAYVKVNESSLVFPRETAPDGLPAPADSLRLPYRTVRFPTADSVVLTAWIVPAARADSSGLWVLLCHGQTGNLATTTRPQYYAYLRSLGVNILAFDWRGFGSSGGHPSEAGLYRDATAAYAYLRDGHGISPKDIIIFGHSLGSAPAIELATRVPAAGLVVEGAPSSVRARAQELYPLLPLRLLPFPQFNSLDRIGRVKMPLLLLHARADKRIPVAHGRALFQAAAGPRRFVELAGEHHDAFLVDSARYFGEYARFLREVAAARP